MDKNKKGGMKDIECPTCGSIVMFQKINYKKVKLGEHIRRVLRTDMGLNTEQYFKAQNLIYELAKLADDICYTHAKTGKAKKKEKSEVQKRLDEIN